MKFYTVKVDNPYDGISQGVIISENYELSWCGGRPIKFTPQNTWTTPYKGGRLLGELRLDHPDSPRAAFILFVPPDEGWAYITDLYLGEYWNYNETRTGSYTGIILKEGGWFRVNYWPKDGFTTLRFENRGIHIFRVVEI